MIKKIDFTRTGDCQKVMDFVQSLDVPMREDHQRLAADAINTLKLNNPQGVDALDYVRIGLGLVAMYN